MKQLKLFAACCALSLLAVACGGAADDVAAPFPTEAAAIQTSGSFAAAAGKDNGTALTLTSAVKTNTCTSTSGANVSLTGSITSSGSVDSADITVSIDGGAPKKLGVINPKDFVHDGRYKTAPYTVALPVPNGDHSAEVCFVQSGAQGRTSKATCAPKVAVHVDCEPPPPTSVCPGVTPAGQLVGDGEICRTNAESVLFQVQGDLGESPALTITGADGFTFAATLESTGTCAYQYAWSVYDIPGGGTYAITATGNNHTVTFNADLTCTIIIIN